MTIFDARSFSAATGNKIMVRWRREGEREGGEGGRGGGGREGGEGEGGREGRGREGGEGEGGREGRERRRERTTCYICFS